MALVRILVDGYSLLHNWRQLARGQSRHSAAAREELIHALTRYRDAIGTPIGYKDANTTSDLLKAFADLFRVWPDALLRTRLEEMLPR